MWVFSTIGMYDLVENRDRKNWIIIKARCKADIFNLYDKYGKEFRIGKPITDPLWDYRWGAHITKKNAMRLIAELVSEINYSLFKGAVHAVPNQHNKTQPYLQIWARMQRVQEEEERPYLAAPVRSTGSVPEGFTPMLRNWYDTQETTYEAFPDYDGKAQNFCSCCDAPIAFVTKTGLCSACEDQYLHGQ